MFNAKEQLRYLCRRIMFIATVHAESDQVHYGSLSYNFKMRNAYSALRRTFAVTVNQQKHGTCFGNYDV